MCRVCKLVKNKQWLEQPYVVVKKKRDKFGIQEEERKLRKELIELKLTEAEIEQHNYNWNMKTGCWIDYRRKEEKEKLNKIKETLELIQLKDGSCALCAIDNDWINEGIFFRGWSVNEVMKELQELEIPIVVSDNEIMNHKRRHLSVKNKKVTYDDEKHIETYQKTIKKRIECNTLTLKDHLDSQILTLSIDIRKMEECDLTESKAYKDKVEMLKSFLDMKMKADGGDVQDVNIVNFWEKVKNEE